MLDDNTGILRDTDVSMSQWNRTSEIWFSCIITLQHLQWCEKQPISLIIIQIHLKPIKSIQLWLKVDWITLSKKKTFENNQDNFLSYAWSLQLPRIRTKLQYIDIVLRSNSLLTSIDNICIYRKILFTIKDSSLYERIFDQNFWTEKSHP